jgi:hypothetical protein
MLNSQSHNFLAVLIKFGCSRGAVVPILVMAGQFGKEASGFLFILEVIAGIDKSL